MRVVALVIIGIVLALVVQTIRHAPCAELHRIHVIEKIMNQHYPDDPLVKTAVYFSKYAYSRYEASCVKRLQAETCDASFIHRTTPDKVVIAFAGSQSTKNWLTNAMNLLHPLNTFIPQATGSVHVGALLTYSVIKKQVLEATQNAQSVLVTGHSLGSALAQIASVDIKLNQPQTTVTNVTFSTPPVGDQTFAQLYNELVDTKRHIVVVGDLIQRLETIKKYTMVQGVEHLDLGRPFFFACPRV